MAEQQKFEIEQGLEGLVNNANVIDKFYHFARAKPELDNVDLRESVAQSFNRPFLRTAEPALFVKQIKARKTETYELLTDELNAETYKHGVSFYTSSLDEGVKNQLYVNLLKEGVIPEKPSDKLKEVIGRLNVAEGIEKALDSEDMDTANVIALNYLRPSQKSDLEDYKVTGSRYGLSGQKDVLRDVVRIQKSMAGAQIAKENLYLEIDNAVE